VRERIQAREANAAQETLTPLEACLVNEIELIKTAHADPEVRGSEGSWILIFFFS